MDDGIILEFKVFNPKKDNSLENVVQTAIQQIIDKKYAVVLGKSAARTGFGFMGLLLEEKRF